MPRASAGMVTASAGTFAPGISESGNHGRLTLLRFLLRQAAGDWPQDARKTLMKCEALQKPHSSAIVAIFSSVSFSITAALRIRSKVINL